MKNDLFTKLAKSWWDGKGPMRHLHLMNPVRMAFIGEHTSFYNKNILDVGCGAGILTESLAKTTAKRVLGIDIVPDLINVARDHGSSLCPKLLYQHATLNNLGKHENLRGIYQAKFDIITALEVIEHVDDPSAFIRDIKKYIKPGGSLVISTISRNWLSYLVTIVMAEKVLKILPCGTHSWFKYIRPHELVTLLNLNGFTVTASAGLWYLPLLNRWFKVRYPKTVNYIVHATFSKPCRTT